MRSGDHVGGGELEALDDVEADAAQPEHDGLCAGLYLGRVEHRADAGRHAAADVADLVERRVLADLRHGDLGQHRVVGEGRAAHVVMQLLAVERESRGAVPHHALPLRGADGGAQVGLARQARRALAAFRRIEGDDVVALLDALHARPDVDDDAGTFMAQDGREQPLGIGTRQGEFVGVTDAGRLDLDQHLASLRPLQLHIKDLQRLALLDGDGGPSFHCVTPMNLTFRAVCVAVLSANI